MKALRVEDGHLRVSDIPIPKNEDEALVRVLVSGICNTDLEIVAGYAGFSGTIGHEFVGIIESAHNGEDLIGRRVVGEINVGCANCELCLSGDSRHCRRRSVLGIVGRDGAHAEFLTLPARNLIPVPDNVDDLSAVFAEPLAAAFGITEQIEIDADHHVAVIGDGKLGLLCVKALALTSANITLIGKHPSKIAIGEKAGANGIELSNITDSMHKRFDVVVEASGSESGFETAVDLVRPRGKIVLKSTFHGSAKWPSSRVVVDEITVVGSRCGRLKPAVDLLATGRVEVQDLLSDEFVLSRGREAVNSAAKAGALKVILRNSH
jgi:threonine dehydrogenase-like Zn-dependent dehydrogenase